MASISSFRDLVVWQRSISLVRRIYETSSDWPKAELYGLTAQIRRAAVSIPANIAEGQGRNGRREFVHHLGIAHGSLCEVETMLIIAHQLEYITSANLAEQTESIREVGRLLHGLLRSLEPKSSQ
jgi:four helix bundle protein